MAGFDAIVLAGGVGRRLGVIDKATLLVGGKPMLTRVLTAVAGAHIRVVAGPPRTDLGPVADDVVWTRETPAGSGPLAGIAAAVRWCTAPVTVVVATDLPWLDATTVHRLVHVPEHLDGIVLIDAEGRRQPLAAAYRTDALRTALERIGDPRDRPVRLLLEHLDVAELRAPRQARDIDTPEDLETVKVTELTEWTQRLADELGVATELADLDLDAILDLARDAAHTIERPAAPLTTFVVGYAAARRMADGTDASTIAACVAEASRLIAGLEQGDHGTDKG